MIPNLLLRNVQQRISVVSFFLRCETKTLMQEKEGLHRGGYVV